MCSLSRAAPSDCCPQSSIAVTSSRDLPAVVDHGYGLVQLELSAFDDSSAPYSRIRPLFTQWIEAKLAAQAARVTRKVVLPGEFRTGVPRLVFGGLGA